MMVNQKFYDLLRQFHSELQAHNTLEMQVRTELRPNRYGWTEKLYAEAASDLWRKLQEAYPDDVIAVHHLTVMHHARAFDREIAQDFRGADRDWRRALELWHHLWQSDRFWEMLAQRMDTDTPNLFDEVRAVLPEQLLQIHFDMALDDTVTPPRARQHIRLALESPFPDTVKDKVRQRAYAQITQHLDAGLWESNMYALEILEPAAQVIISYLKLDVQFRPALNDLLMIISKIQSVYSLQITENVTPEQYEDKIRQIYHQSMRYDAYLKQLEHNLSELDLDQLADLTSWHSLAADAAHYIDKHEAAIEHYQRALAAAEKEGVPWTRRERLHKGRVRCTIEVAHNCARDLHHSGNRERARALLDMTVDEHELPAIISLMRGEAWAHIGEYEHAKRDYDAAPSAHDWQSEYAQYHKDLSEFIERQRAASFYWY